MDFLDTLNNNNWVINLPYDILRLVGEYTNINNLLNTCSQLHQFKELKRSSLIEDAIEKYCNDIDFRNFINEITNIHELIIDNCQNVTDVSVLGKVHTLHLRNCKGITDVSALGKVHTLTILWCLHITDLSALGNVHELTIGRSHNITDVSALGDIPNLTITGCSNLTDVSALRNVQNFEKFLQ